MKKGTAQRKWHFAFASFTFVRERDAFSRRSPFIMRTFYCAINGLAASLKITKVFLLRFVCTPTMDARTCDHVNEFLRPIMPQFWVQHFRLASSVRRNVDPPASITQNVIETASSLRNPSTADFTCASVKIFWLLGDRRGIGSIETRNWVIKWSQAFHHSRWHQQARPYIIRRDPEKFKFFPIVFHSLSLRSHFHSILALTFILRRRFRSDTKQQLEKFMFREVFGTFHANSLQLIEQIASPKCDLNFYVTHLESELRGIDFTRAIFNAQVIPETDRFARPSREISWKCWSIPRERRKHEKYTREIKNLERSHSVFNMGIARGRRNESEIRIQWKCREIRDKTQSDRWTNTLLL